MSILVTYKSNTGFTKKYAEWIAEALSCDLSEISKVSAADVKNHELVIFGGWLMGGMISGLNKIKSLSPKKLIVFGVGLTPKEHLAAADCASANKLGDTPFFYFDGGADPKKMGFFGRTIVGMVTKQKVEYVDNTDRSEIGELVTLASSITSNK